MNRTSLMIVGCGDLGSRLVQQLDAGQWRLYGSRRRLSLLPATVQPVAAELSVPACPADWPDTLDYLVYCVAPDGSTEQQYRAAYIDGLRHVLGWLEQRHQRLRRLLFVSSSAVYAQQEGEWIDEDSPAEAQTISASVLREAEQLAASGLSPATVVRLTGIYGPGRNGLLSQVRAGLEVPAEPVMYGNRIHVDDAANLLAHLLDADRQGKPLQDRYLGVDDQPAPLFDVVSWLREQLSVTTVAANTLRRRGGSKRCRNDRARALGWVPRYANFREGYAEILRNDRP